MAQSGEASDAELVDLPRLLSRWPGVGLRHLAAFQAIVEESSFRRAAARLRYTQPTISHQLATLEGALGVALIERGVGGHSTRPTAAGRALLPHIQRIAEALRELEVALDLAADEQAPRASSPTALSRGAEPRSKNLICAVAADR